MAVCKDVQKQSSGHTGNHAIGTRQEQTSYQRQDKIRTFSKESYQRQDKIQIRRQEIIHH